LAGAYFLEEVFEITLLTGVAFWVVFGDGSFFFFFSGIIKSISLETASISSEFSSNFSSYYDGSLFWLALEWAALAFSNSYWIAFAADSGGEGDDDDYSEDVVPLTCIALAYSSTAYTTTYFGFSGSDVFYFLTTGGSTTSSTATGVSTLESSVAVLSDPSSFDSSTGVSSGWLDYYGVWSDCWTSSALWETLSSVPVFILLTTLYKSF
jgi:hypothetical protein